MIHTNSHTQPHYRDIDVEVSATPAQTPAMVRRIRGRTRRLRAITPNTRTHSAVGADVGIVVNNFPANSCSPWWWLLPLEDTFAGRKGSSSQSDLLG
jgi:hypothetical protein